MVRNVIDGNLDDVEELFRKTRRPRLVYALLQILGAITFTTGLMLVSVAVGLCVLGCLMILFGVAIERGLYAR